MIANKLTTDIIFITETWFYELSHTNLPNYTLHRCDRADKHGGIGIPNLRIAHWNSNSIKNKKHEFISFLNQHNPDLVSINETKLDSDANFGIHNYSIIRLDKSSRSGGVMVLIKEGIKFEQTDILDKFNLQLITIKISINQSNKFHFITMYLPPQDLIPEEDFFRSLNSLKHFVLVGDLNSKSKAWYCKNENPNGKLLNSALLKSPNIAVVKNKTPTQLSTFKTYDILHLFLVSSNLLSSIISTNGMSYRS